MKPRLIMMVKEPVPGRVKTRLGKDIGMVRAAAWFRHQSLQTIAHLEDPRWDLVLAVSPDKQGLSSRFWPKHIARQAQGRGDLGDRMKRQLMSSKGKVCVIGADIPNIMPKHIASAFAALGSHSATIGPSDDGGYWLVGLRHGATAPRSLFQDVRWSTQWAMQDTMASAADLSWAQINTLRDVDTVADLKRV